MFLKIEDFRGFYSLSHNQYSRERFTEVAEDVEKHYLKRLLGNDLHQALLNDLDTENKPQLDRFTVLFEPNYFNYCGTAYESEGIVEMLKGFVYWEFMRSEKNKPTIVGRVKSKNETSEIVSHSQALIDARYNRAISTYKALQQMIDRAKENYPEYQTSELNKIFFGGAF